jgi:hypothetical protein
VVPNRAWMGQPGSPYAAGRTPVLPIKKRSSKHEKVTGDSRTLMMTQVKHLLTKPSGAVLGPKDHRPSGQFPLLTALEMRTEGCLMGRTEASQCLAGVE